MVEAREFESVNLLPRSCPYFFCAFSLSFFSCFIFRRSRLSRRCIFPAWTQGEGKKRPWSETEPIGEGKGRRLLYRSAGKSPCAFRTMTSSSFARAAILRSDFIVKSRGIHALAHPTTSVLNPPKKARYAICFLLLIHSSHPSLCIIFLQSLAPSSQNEIWHFHICGCRTANWLMGDQNIDSNFCMLSVLLISVF